jgi:hypothetical protein
MYGDLVIDARLTFNKLTTVTTDPRQQFQLGDLNYKLGVIGKDCTIATATANITDQVLNLAWVGFRTFGYMGLKNMYPALIATPGTPSVGTTGGGSTRYEYKIVATQADGAYTQASPPGIITNGPATLDATHANGITWSPIVEAVSYSIWRTVGGGAFGQGWIADVPAAGPFTIFDVGLAGSGAQPPATSPFDFRIQFGPTNASYPILLKGADMQVFRWNFAASNAIHFKTLVNVYAFFAYMIIEE